MTALCIEPTTAPREQMKRIQTPKLAAYDSSQSISTNGRRPSVVMGRINEDGASVSGSFMSGFRRNVAPDVKKFERSYVDAILADSARRIARREEVLRAARSFHQM